MKQHSAFYPATTVERVRRNVRHTAWGATAAEEMVAAAAPWLALSDDQLWEAMFGHRITRSWMVWSNGHCPACEAQTPMYTWEIDALARPWKVRCPHCAELFPKNDFEAFHRSGLDAQGVFDPTRGDRQLLFNSEHPDRDDPRHSFGVDDGEGYVDGEQRWRFIGAYLIYGQWKQFVLGGIDSLSAAYVVTGDVECAHRAGVLLDRVADLYATFDFEKEGLAYETGHSTGYVSTWHDACEETRQLAEAYDRVFPALRRDAELVRFLGSKAAAYGLAPKRSWHDIQRNIESGILQEALNNPHKIHSNYPRRENALLVIETVLGWPANRERVRVLLDEILTAATAVDGMTGEKGLAGYGTIGPRGVAQILGMFARLEPGFLREVYARHPALHQLFRFHVDTRCLGRFYPHVGDSGGFARPVDGYAGATFTERVNLEPSPFSFLMELAELTGDPAFVQVLFEGNGSTVEQLPRDLFAGDPATFQRQAQAVIDAHGEFPALQSVNKQAWHIALLRSGARKHERVLWLHYDAGGRHSHRDGLNLGLMAHGMDLLPEFGYPPVQFGGWGSPRANWYKMTAGHNTVVVDGQDQQDGSGETALWAVGDSIQAIRVAAPDLYAIEQYERTAILANVDPEHCYVVDIFRVRGGSDHARFLHSGFGSLEIQDLTLRPMPEYGHGTQMRNFRGMEHAPSGWRADWQLEDRFGVLEDGSEVLADHCSDADVSSASSDQGGDREHGSRCSWEADPPTVGLRCIDLTADASVCQAEAWVSLGYDAENLGAWIPRLMVRRQGTAPLQSVFVAVLAPHTGACPVVSARRLPLRDEAGRPCSDTHVALEITLADGRQDVVVALDAQHAPSTVKQGDWRLSVSGELCWARRGGAAEGGGRPLTDLALVNGTEAGTTDLQVSGSGELVETQRDNRAEFMDLFGSWSRADREEFDAATEEMGQVDPGDWE
jgi:oligo-alginate lyase